MGLFIVAVATCFLFSTPDDANRIDFDRFSSPPPQSKHGRCMYDVDDKLLLRRTLSSLMREREPENRARSIDASKQLSHPSLYLFLFLFLSPNERSESEKNESHEVKEKG